MVLKVTSPNTASKSHQKPLSAYQLPWRILYSMYMHAINYDILFLYIIHYSIFNLIMSFEILHGIVVSSLMKVGKYAILYLCHIVQLSISFLLQIKSNSREASWGKCKVKVLYGPGFAIIHQKILAWAKMRWRGFFLSIWEIFIRQILPEPRPLLHSIEIQLCARLYNMANH